MALHQHQLFLELLGVRRDTGTGHIVPTQLLLLVVCVPMENGGRLVLGHVELEELFQFVAELGGPLFRAKRSEGRMLQWILNVGQGVKLEELASA